MPDGETTVESVAESTLANRAGLARLLPAARRVFPVAAVLFVLLLAIRQAQTINWTSTWTQLRHTRLSYFLLAAAIYYSAFTIRVIRWKVLLSNAGYDRRRVKEMPSLVGLLLITYRAWSMNAVTIGQVGDGYRAYAFKKRSGAPGAPVLGTIVAERIVDTVVLAGLMIPTVAIAFRSHLSTDAVWALTIAGAVAVAGPLFLRSLPRIIEFAGRYLPQGVAAMLTHLSDGFSKSLGRMPLVVTLSALGWAGESGMYFFAARAAGIPISFADAATVALVTALLTALPVTPGGLGVAETGIVIMLGQLGVAAGPAAAIAVLARSISFLSVILGGGIAWLFVPKSDRREAEREIHEQQSALAGHPTHQGVAIGEPAGGG